MKRYQMSESLPVGLLLALAGGILDSYTYLNRGQVFATAETGNLVLLGIHLAQGELGRVLSCLFPILAFALGVLTTEGLRRRLSSGRVHWRQPILAAECLVILVVSFLFSVLEKGSSVVQSQMGLSSDCAAVLQGIILFFILASEFLVRYSFVLRKKEKSPAPAAKKEAV